MRIIGLDPGLQTTGWGIIDIQPMRQGTYVAHGTIRTSADQPIDQRLCILHQGIMAVLNDYTPQAAAVEDIFVNKNPASALKLGLARGIVIATPAIYGLSVAEYGANKVKKAIVGAGHADKTQVAHMVQRLLKACPVVANDAADALAVALCHGHHVR